MFITWTNLHLGRYEQLLDDAPLLIAADKKRGFPPHIGFRFVALGFAALAGKRFELAQNYFGKSIATLENIQANENLTWAKVGLAYLALSEGYTITANSHLTNVFQSSIDNKLFWSILFAIPAVSLLLIEYGAGGRAIELYTLACTHDFVANSQLFYDIAGQKIDAHTAALPPNVVTAAQEHGRSLDLIQTAESLLQELTTNQPN